MVITHKMIEQGYSSSCSLPDSDRLQIAWYVNLSTCSGLMRLWFPCGTQKFLFLFKEMLRDIYASGGGGLDGGLFGSKAPRNKYNLSSFDTKEFVTDQEMCFFMHCNMQTDSVINIVTVKEGRKSWRTELKREDMWTTWTEFSPDALKLIIVRQRGYSVKGRVVSQIEEINKGALQWLNVVKASVHSSVLLSFILITVFTVNKCPLNRFLYNCCTK